MCGCSDKCVLWCPCACHDEQRKRVTFVEWHHLHERVEAIEKSYVKLERLDIEIEEHLSIHHGIPTPPPEAATTEETKRYYRVQIGDPPSRFEEIVFEGDPWFARLDQITGGDISPAASAAPARTTRYIPPCWLPCGCSTDDVGSTLTLCLKHSDEAHKTAEFFASAAEARPEQTGKRCAYGMTRQEHFTPGQRAGKGEK